MGTMRVRGLRTSLRSGGCARARRALRHCALCANGDEREQTHGCDYNSKKLSLHVYLTRTFWDTERGAAPVSLPSRPQCPHAEALSGAVLPQSVTLAIGTGGRVLA